MSRVRCRLGIRSLKSLRFWLSLVIFLSSAFFILQLVIINTSVSFTKLNRREILKLFLPENRLPTVENVGTEVVGSLQTTAQFLHTGNQFNNAIQKHDQIRNTTRRSLAILQDNIKPFATTVALNDKPPDKTIEHEISQMRRTATISDTERERRHKQAMARIAPFQHLRPFPEKLFHLIDTFTVQKQTKLMDIYDQLILDLWNFYKDNATYDGQHWDTWDNDDDERHHHEINCTNIHQIRIGKRLGGGYIKVAYEGDFLGQKVVVKVKNMKNNNYPGVCGWENFTCAVYRDIRIMNELLVMDHMDHPMISRVLGYCIHSGLGTADFLEEPGVLSVYELGEPLNFTAVRFMYWKDRVTQALKFADFLNYVEHSPFGPLTLYDLELGQFIVTRSQICLTDMDLADNMPDPLCNDMPLHNVTTKIGANVTKCHFAYPFNLGYVFDIPCIDGVCRQVGPKHNMHKLYLAFLTHIFYCRYCPKDLQNELASISHEVHDYMPAEILVNRLQALPHGVDVAFNSTYV